MRGGEKKTQNQKTKIQNPKSKIQNPKSKIQNPKSKIQNPKPKTQNPKPKTQNPKPKTQNPMCRVATCCPRIFVFGFGVRYAHTAFAVDLPTPVRRLDLSQASGGVGRGLFEHVDAQRIVRVPQPRLFVMDRGTPAGAVNRGSPSLAYLSWRSKKGKQLPGCPRRSWLNFAQLLRAKRRG
jgi:hypothetical protein